MALKVILTYLAVLTWVVVQWPSTHALSQTEREVPLKVVARSTPEDVSKEEKALDEQKKPIQEEQKRRLLQEKQKPQPEPEPAREKPKKWKQKPQPEP